MTLIELDKVPVKTFLPLLLADKTTGRNIIFATDAYKSFGFDEKAQITIESLEQLKNEIQPRVSKSLEVQAARTRTKAEVFTPSWIVNKMNNHCDEEWFGRTGVFNQETEQSWKTNKRKISFGKKKDGWKEYVLSKRIEITCGEAPYIVSRYDASTGEIIDIENRIGILDRKLRVINENTETEEEWLEWTKKAFQSVYGYEFQGDNLLIARVNIFLTFVAYYQARYIHKPTNKVMKEIAGIITWNIWQMDGITGTVPFAKPKEKQMGLFDFIMDEGEEEMFDVECKVKDWTNNSVTTYIKIKEGK